MPPKVRRPLLLGVIIIVGFVAVLATNCNGPNNEVCSIRGTHSLFVAKFDNDTVGSAPAPSTPLHYGPPGARLDCEGATNAYLIVDSAALGSRALKLARGQPKPSICDSILGNIDDVPNSAGIYYIDFKAHGKVIPQHFIAGMVISVRSTDELAALSSKLHDGAYHLLTDSGSVPLAGTYDPSVPHSIHIELNLDTQRFAMCVNDEVVSSNELFSDTLSDFHSLRFFAPATITEAFPMEYVVDEIRITK